MAEETGGVGLCARDSPRVVIALGVWMDIGKIILVRTEV